MTQFKHTALRAKSAKAQLIASERLPVQQDSQKAVLHSGELGSPINNSLGLSLRGQTNKLIDHRLLTGKLGGWGHGPSSGGESTQQAHHQGEKRAAGKRVYLHGAPRALPSCLIKLINQLMRHGKKGLSVGLVADSLTLFLKRLEEGGRSNSRNDALDTTIFSKQIGRQGKNASSEGVIQPKGIPSFPFYSSSFPGTRFGDMFSPRNIKSNTLLGLPFSGTLSPHFDNIRLSFIEKSGKYRGSLGFKRARNLDAGKDQILTVVSHVPPLAYAPTCWDGNVKEQPINQETLIFDKGQSPISVISRQNSSRTEMGVRSHTQKPIYFWHMEGSPTLPLPLRLNFSKSVKVKETLSLAQPRLTGHQGIPSQTSTLDSLIRAIANVEPSLEVRKKKIAGITRHIPCVVSKPRGERLAIRWIINSAREKVEKRGKGLPYCLAEELIDAYHKRGEPRQKRDSLHKAAESNRSFLRYRWW